MTITERYVADGDDWVNPAGVRVPRGINVPRLIIDTDFATDCDDVGGIAVAHALADLGECELLAMGVSATCNFSTSALGSLNTWHGRPDIPVGQFKGSAETVNVSNCGAYVEGMHNNGDWPSSVGLGTTVDDVVDVYRQSLHDAPDGSVTLVTIGFLTGVSALLDSAGDSIDSRSGADLVAAKVKRTYVMGANPGGGAEFNMAGAPAAASNVAANWPGEIVWNPFEVGNAVFTGKWGVQPADHIVRFAYQQFGVNQNNGRQSWDLVTVLQAVRGNEDRFSVERGDMFLDGSTGQDTWTPDVNGRDLLTSLDTSASNLETEIEPLMWSPQV